LHLVPFHEIAADHFEYLPMVGVALVAGLGFSHLHCCFSMRVLLWAGVFLAALGLSFLVVQRNRDWQNSETLWAATYESAPGSYRANANLGEIYFRQGLEAGIAGGEMVNEGLRLTRNSIELDPSRSVSWGNLGAMYLTLGQHAREAGDLEKAKEYQSLAIEQFQQALELEPKNAFTESNLGNVYKELGNVYEAEGREEDALAARKQAVEVYRRALQTLDRRHEVQIIWLNFGGVFIDAGYYDQATYYLSEFLGAYPDDPRGNYWMGFCLSEEGEYASAIPYLEKAVAGKPTVEAWSQLALSYGNSGQLKKGIEGYTRILRVKPDSSEIHYQLGLLYRKAGESSKAASHLDRALRLEPRGEHAERIRRMLGEGST
jgi:tetratricopeptide (TPR) repeat protein